MNISFIIKASTKIGYGHLIRSRTLANRIQNLKHRDDHISYYIIGNSKLDILLSKVTFDYIIFESEEELIKDFDNLKLNEVVIFDLLTVEEELFKLARRAPTVISLSPIFNWMDSVDVLFHRTKYHNYQFNEKTQVHKGLEYTLIQETCKPIETSSFKKHLSEEKLSIAVSMGGGDAANKSLAVIKELNKLKKDYIVWLMLGQGYKYSYDELIEESKKSHHEIILAKTNTSMWKVLSLCSLLILPGGVTSYEAAFVGLPTINVIRNKEERYLIQELLELGIADEVEAIDTGALIEKVDFYNENRSELFTCHTNSKGVIGGFAANLIYEEIIKRRSRL